ncbi:MHS family MFS transporter [Achromobacter sp. ES-001]|uniref:MFS transporter n=1 Tax=Achromobacter sp. ES-001 TaxID=2860286 RepID=UPI001C6440F4|nr:MFS transporter [Achromobacter sp. ES-001]QYJ20766.1 MHS family MFS transporter [Achromobacter sp. ES-001]
MEAISRPDVNVGAEEKPNLLRISVATVVGTAVEAFDFLAYGTAAALVFNKLFFPQFDPLTGTLAAFAAFASGMLARPIGGILFGHFGDRIGRKSMLTLSLLMMGICTVLIGLLPTYEQIGVWAPILLVALRIGQGLSFGGELGGAMLMAVEHAPPRWKGLFGSLPLVGSPLGILLSVGAFALVTRLPEEDFLSWGWRLPFLASAVLIVVGILIRRGIDESPDFARVKAEQTQVKLPVAELLGKHGKALLLCVGCKLAEVTLIYTFLVFSVSYAVSTLGFSRSDALQALLYGAAVMTFTIPVFGMLGDRFGARRVCGWGGLLLAVMAVPIFMAVGSGSLFAYSVAAFVAMALNYAMMIAPQSSLYAAQFPPELRYSGLSIGVQFSAAIGGGLAPMVSAMLVARFDSIVPVGAYLAVLGVVAGTSAFLMKPTTRARSAP